MKDIKKNNTKLVIIFNLIKIRLGNSLLLHTLITELRIVEVYISNASYFHSCVCIYFMILMHGRIFIRAFPLTVCESGTYGMDCMNNCSRDCRGQACNHISGTCTSCNVGYRGQFCTDGIF